MQIAALGRIFVFVGTLAGRERVKLPFTTAIPRQLKLSIHSFCVGCSFAYTSTSNLRILLKKQSRVQEDTAYAMPTFPNVAQKDEGFFPLLT